MWNLSAPPATVAPATARPLPASPYAGPERRRNNRAPHLLAAMLDEVDHALLLLQAGGRVLHANHLAQAELRGQHPLCLQAQQLHVRHAHDAAPLQAALRDAAERGLRKLLMLGEAGRRCGLSVVPLASPPGGAAEPGGGATVLLMLGRPEQPSPLPLQAYARAHHLSGGEEQVLRALCEGISPAEIAARHGVKISTVRTQISQIRAKTQTDSIRELLQQVARLPPMVGALRGVAPAPAHTELAALTA